MGLLVRARNVPRYPPDGGLLPGVASRPESAYSGLNPAATSLLVNLSTWWALEGLTDSSGNANTLTNNGVATFNTGKVNNGVYLARASSQFLSIADNTFLSTGNIDFLFAGWVYLTVKNVTQGIFSKWDGVGTNREYIAYYLTSSDRFYFAVSPDGSGETSVLADNFGAVPTTTWVFLECWHDAANDQIGIRVNRGTANTASHTTGVRDGAAGFRLGSDHTTNYVDGRQDEFAMWKRIPTSAELDYLYNSGNGRTISGGIVV